MLRDQFPTWVSLLPKVDTEWDACLQTLEDYGCSVAFSPDGGWLASASSNVKLWDAATGDCIMTFNTHGGEVRSVAFSPDGRWLASASGDYEAWSDDEPVPWTIELWDVATGDRITTFDRHSSFINSVAFSPDGRWLASASGDYEASASDDRTVKLWDVATGDCITTFEGHSNSVDSVTFSPDSSRLASASGDLVSVKLWDVSTGDCIAALDVGTVIYSLAFDVTGSRLNTDIGTFVLNLPSSTQVATVFPTPGYLPQTVDRRGIGLSKDKAWVTWDSHKILWLPPAYRPRMSAVTASTVAIGCPLGRVVLMTFSAVNGLVNSTAGVADA
jgi:WD40 repeat protein